MAATPGDVVVVPVFGLSASGSSASLACPGDAASSCSTAVSTAPSTWTSSELAVLPRTVVCTFAGEGSANAVFQLRVDEDKAEKDEKETDSTDNTDNTDNTDDTDDTDDTAHLLRSHLLRVPKDVPGLSPHVCIDHHAYYASVLQPLVGSDYLVAQRLVRGVDLLRPQLNRLLAAHDAQSRRRADWAGRPIAAGVDVALLVEDMTCDSSASSAPFTIQFKPKWLAQSPTAPPNARRCRTCALAAFLSSHGPAQSRTPRPCPLVLIAGREAADADTDDALWDYVCRHLGDRRLPLAARTAIVRWLRTTDLFRRLATIQTTFDPIGALALSLEDGIGDTDETDITDITNITNITDTPTATALARLQTAMTLRDCTCFLRVSLLPDGRVETIGAKLGDLDRKAGRHRLKRWQDQERDLLQGGFYMATEKPQQPTNCWLNK